MTNFQKDPNGATQREKFEALSAPERVSFLSRVWDNPQLRYSPASSVDIVTDYDEDGWEVWTTYAVGDLVQSFPSGDVWRVVGFTKDDQVLCRPHGLTDGLIAGATFAPGRSSGTGERGLEPFSQYVTETVYSHRDGLVSFQ